MTTSFKNSRSFSVKESRGVTDKTGYLKQTLNFYGNLVVRNIPSGFNMGRNKFTKVNKRAVRYVIFSIISYLTALWFIAQ